MEKTNQKNLKEKTKNKELKKPKLNLIFFLIFRFHFPGKKQQKFQFNKNHFEIFY